MIRDRFCGAAFMSYVLIIRLARLSCRCEITGMRNHAGKCTLVTVNRAMFSGYNREAHEFTQHIMVCNAHAQALAGLLGGLSGLPAPLPGGAAITRPRQSFRRRLTFLYVLTLSSV